jgi:hypothetical protein
MEAKKNVFSNYQFNTIRKNTVFDYLTEQCKYLTIKTGGVLRMEVLVMDGCTNGNPKLSAATYILSVKSPQLGNFSKNYLTITETLDLCPFPVDIVINDYCDDDDTINSVSEDKFLETIQEILLRPSIKRSIESLYKQSIENK